MNKTSIFKLLIAITAAVSLLFAEMPAISAGDASVSFQTGVFSDVEIEAGSYLDPEPEAEYDEVGLGAISLMPDASSDENGVASSGDTGKNDAGSDNSDSSGSLSGLMSDSGDFDLDFWMEGFNPDADFGGLGFEAETGPGVVSIGAYDTDGDFINGFVITEDGFRTNKSLSGGVPYEIDQVPYGARVYGIYLTYSFDIESVNIVKHVVGSGGETTPVRVEAADFDNLPPVEITDETLKWEITFILRQSMRIDVNYYLVSPNDRFYYLSDKTMDSYHINTFKDAPVRIAVYIEMPALKNIRKICVRGEGFADACDIADGGEASAQWIVEDDYGDFSLPDLTFTDRSWQLVSCDSDIEPGNVTFIRFFIVSLPSAFEEARMKFIGLTLTMDDGSEMMFDSPTLSELVVWLADVPKLL